MALLGHVLWIGGPPGCGKTSVATRIARRHGVRWYGADTQTWSHRDRALAAGNRAALRWEQMTPSQRWEGLTPAELLELSLHAERGAMVVEDLQRLPTSPLIVAEGSPLSPAVVSSGVAQRSRAIWLLPTPEFQRARLDERKLRRGPCELHLRLAAEIERDARKHGAPILVVDGSRDVDEMVEVVEGLFVEALARGPRAESIAQRRALLREANLAIVSQIRAYYSRPWADGSADTAVGDFLCECGDTGCQASIPLTVAAVSAVPALAAGHG